MINKKIIIASTIKNESKNLKNYFKTLDKLIINYKDYFIILVISDSNDNSLMLCKNYLSNKNGKIIIKNFKKKLDRIKKLEISRNEYLYLIKKKYFNFDFLIVMDVDNVNTNLDVNQLERSLKKKNWNAIFPSQRFFYYDIFALRIKKILNFNFIEKISEDILQNKKNHNIKIYFKKNLFNYFFLNKFSNKRYISVESAFGGLAVYKINKILKFKYSSSNGKECEHVYFNKKINLKYGHLFIDKKLINSSGINKHTINGFLCSYSNYFAKRFLKKIKLLSK